jgi:hypothetical protein
MELKGTNEWSSDGDRMIRLSGEAFGLRQPAAAFSSQPAGA